MVGKSSVSVALLVVVILLLLWFGVVTLPILALLLVVSAVVLLVATRKYNADQRNNAVFSLSDPGSPLDQATARPEAPYVYQVVNNVFPATWTNAQ
jgi:hypothetical protein